ncbi:hypothetical protein Tco_0198805 [Tanacetum coccineum]
MANLDFCDKHNMVAYLQKSEGSEGFHQIIDFLTTSHIRYALTESPTIYVSLIEQFWQTASASTLENGDMEITATIDGKVKVVSEASIRRHLKLEDSDGISTLPTSEIFKQLALMGAPSTPQPPTLPPFMQTTHVAEEVATMPYDSPLLRVHSLRSDEGSMTLNELTVLCTILSKKVETLESDLKQTKLKYGVAYTKLIIKVKKLKHKVKSSKARRRGRHEHDFEEFDFKFISPEEDYTSEPDNSTAGVEVSTASPEVKTAAEKEDKFATREERLGLEEALRLKEQLDEEERQRIARVHEEASTFNAEEWDNIQAQINADEGLAHSSKRQKTGEGSEPAKESKDKLSQEQLQQLMIIVPEEGMNVEDLQTKYSIIDWEVYPKDSRMYL